MDNCDVHKRKIPRKLRKLSGDFFYHVRKVYALKIVRIKISHSNTGFNVLSKSALK